MIKKFNVIEKNISVGLNTLFSFFSISVTCVRIIIQNTYVIIFLVGYFINVYFAFQYLRLRFNQNVRLLGSIIFIIKMLLYIPIVIYVPALAFSQGIMHDSLYFAKSIYVLRTV